MPGEPRVIVSRATSSKRDQRIYLATYPAMMECFEEFDVGFFDLIVADESHRSIYKKFQSIFRYFDAMQVGLTATPVRFIERNTYKLFECEDQDPTSSYGFEEAITANPPYLVPFRVRTFSSQFKRDGVKYAQMDAEQREQADDQDAAASLINYEPDEVDVKVMNKPSTRFIWQKLMEEGIREGTGSQVGKTIVFARNHNHAVHMAEVFHETYPQYGSSFCRVIDNQEKYAEDLIDNFKSNDPSRQDPLVIAISVDMLDTGIDVPEVVNLVFAKPVKSYVKFWQMIGRGTRLSKDLFGAGKHKTEFLIFDFWSNFWFFDEQYTEKEPSKQKALLQQLFEVRIAVAQAALDKMQETDFQALVDLLLADLRDLKDAGNLEVRDHWREIELLSDRNLLAQFAAPTKNDLLSIAAPLMHWRPIRGFEEAYRFDLLMTRLELELLRAGPTGSRVLDFKTIVEEQVELLMKNQNPVKAKTDTINQVRSKEFWATVTAAQLEHVRLELRGIMKYQQQAPSGRVAPQILDIDDADFSAETYIPRLEGLDLVEYKIRVEKVLKEKFAKNAVVERIRAGAEVGESELEDLARMVLEVDDKANVRHLIGHNPETRKSLLTVFRSLVGLDPGAIEKAFTAFVHKHLSLSAQQLRFLQVLQNYIAQNGGIELDRLYEPPFTTVHAESVDGVFTKDGEVDDLLAIISTFAPKKAAADAAPTRSQQAS
jgi:type I restriction enzyme, R subunit